MTNQALPSVQIKTDVDLKVFLHKNYMAQIQNFFGNQQRAMKFLSSVMSSVQKTPALLECDPTTLINSFMTMAQLALMPSDVSGEAYVLPYSGKAQFQLGYQGLITLFYRAGGTSIRAELVRANDSFSFVNGEIKHTIDIFKSNDQRGAVIGAYAIAKVGNQEIAKAMNIADIIKIGAKFSKSYGSKFSPWKEENDPEGMMYKKTVLKQLGKLLPKNETINRAIAADNEDSVIADRLAPAEEKSNELTMGSIVKPIVNHTESKPAAEKSFKDEIDELQQPK
jgi:recombination protein RecT